MSDATDGFANRQPPPLPSAFVWRRLHSLTGLFLVLFLIVHLFTNSQAALYVGDDGKGFIHAVNSIHNFPYLSAIELLLLGVPFLIHIVWGVRYIWTARYNSFKTDGSTPSLPEYRRNRAYTWQRWTAWILLIGVIAHVYQMRFVHYPMHASWDNLQFYMVPISADNGLYTLARRVQAQIYEPEQVKKALHQLQEGKLPDSLFGLQQKALPEASMQETVPSVVLDQLAKQRQQQITALTETIEGITLHEGEVLAVADNFATAELFMVRDTFKSPIMIALYSLFVLAAVYHAFNGLWTFMISWGVTLNQRSQANMHLFCVACMVLIAFFGLAAAWGTYWMNLYT